MLSRIAGWIALVAVTLFILWVMLSGPGAMETCLKTHSKGVCVHTLR